MKILAVLSQWQYSATSIRDERIDFLRGVAIVMMLIAHVEIVSLFNILTWERFGLTTGAEAFVILSGFVLGSINRRRLRDQYLLTVSYTLYRRAFKIYAVNIAIIIIIYFMNKFRFLNLYELSHFTDRFANVGYPTFPLFHQSREAWVNLILYLQIGPHQSQILGLYIFLLFFSPLILWLLKNNQWLLLFAISFSIYVFFQFTRMRILSSQFANAFPVMAWQFIYVLGLMAGWYRDELSSLIRRTSLGALVKYTVITLALLFAFIAQNHEQPFLPKYLFLHLIPNDFFEAFYTTFAPKNELGVYRVINDFCLIMTGYYVLSTFWVPIRKYFGWLFVTLGANSLYSFIVHVFIVLLVSQFIKFDLWHYAWFFNTFIHCLGLILLWLCARYQVGRRFIPN